MIKDVRGRFVLAAVTVLCGAASTVPASTGGNDFYQVMVEETPAGVGVGVHTFMTGVLHPVAGSFGMQDVLVGRGIPGTSFMTVRSYTSGTDYVQRNGMTLASGAPPTFELEGFVAAGEEASPVGDPLSPTGFTTTYRPGGFAPAPDDLVITQTAAAVGATFDDAAVMLRTEITNNGASPIAIGVRYLWDTVVGSNDDGPSFKAKGPDGPRLSTDASFSAPASAGFEMMDDNDPDPCFGMGNSPFPFYAVQGSVTGPASLGPTAPSRLAFVSWPDASGLPSKFGGVTPAQSAFDYQASGSDVTTCLFTNDDTGVAYWWGDSAANALTIAPGATVSVTAYVFAYLPGQPPTFPASGVEGPSGDPTCSDVIDNDGDGMTDGDDADCDPPGNPVEGPWDDPSCSDGIDNDGDGLTDSADADCETLVEGPWNDPSCSDGIDNDGDGLTDSADADCEPPVEGPWDDPSCSDGIDNDEDGFADGADADCTPPVSPVEGPTGDPSCSDGIDNDGDGLTDGDDADCASPNSPPDCAGAVPSAGMLWPPNHAFRQVRIRSVTDSDGDPMTITVTSIMQDEATYVLGEGSTGPDASGVGSDTVSLRAERSGTADGRIYHVAFTADDGEGGSCTGEVTVCVPHSRRRDAGCVDQGALYDSTRPGGGGSRKASRR